MLYLTVSGNEQIAEQELFIDNITPPATTSSEQDHDNAIFGSENISLSSTTSSVVQEEPMAVSVKVMYIKENEHLHTCS